MTELSSVILIVFVLYFGAMLAIGVAASRKTHSPAGFFLADRSLKAWVTAVSSTASSESAWAVLGTVGLAYKEGLSAAWFLPGCLLGYLLNWLYLAEPLRKHSHETRSITLPDYLESHFQDRTHLLRWISVGIIFACMMAYVAAQFTAIGKTFDSIFGVSHWISIPVGGAIVLGYTMMGGFLAVAWTDFVQGLIMVVGLVLLSVVAVASFGGPLDTWEAVRQANPDALSLMGGKTLAAFLGGVVGLLGIGLGYPGQPHVLNRYMAAKNEKVIRDGLWIALGWGGLMYTSAIVLGVAGNALFPGLEDPEHLFPQAAEALLPTVLSAVVLTGVLAAIMSTVSAQIIVAASSVAHDIVGKLFRKDLTHRQTLLVSRATIGVLGVGAMAISLMKTQVIFWFVLFAWSGLGASFGPLLLFTLYSKRVTWQGAVAGMVTGFMVTILWKVTGLSESVVYELVPAFFLASAAIWTVSCATSPEKF